MISPHLKLLPNLIPIDKGTTKLWSSHYGVKPAEVLQEQPLRQSKVKCLRDIMGTDVASGKEEFMEDSVLDW